MNKSIVNSSMPHTLLNEHQQEFFDSVGYSCFNVDWMCRQVPESVRAIVAEEVRERQDETDG